MMNRTAPPGRRTLLLGLALAPLVIATGACGDDLLSVETPSRIPAAGIEQPANAELLVNSAIGDFECAAGSYAALGGLIGDELIDATQTADRYPYDRRDIQSFDRRYATFGCAGALGVYTPLQVARASAERVLRLLQGWTDEEVPGDRTEMIALTSVYAGYSYVLLGEGFCSMAISSIGAGGEQLFGGEILPDSVLELAVDHFTNALAATAIEDTRNMALVGRARALLNLGRLQEAKADAELVPADFEAVISASSASSRRENKVWQQTSALSSAAAVGAYYINIDDPRIPTDTALTSTGAPRTSVTGVLIVYQTKFDEAGSPIPLASGDEARLIVAEAEIAAGNFGAARTIIDAFRTAAGQSAFAGGDAELMAELIEQRRRELFLEGQHLGDYIRYNLPLTPPAGAAYHGSGVYGDQRCLPLPDVEKLNNPAIT
ncbi:MAG: RagB/SusD family nutrient uptake outer membrane protein [Gemmatimonadaceae bacterium]